MAEAKQSIFSYREVAEALVKKQGIREGFWGIYLGFSLKGANIGPDDDRLEPAAIMGVSNIGIQRFAKENNLTVDAAKVNPPPKRSKKTKK